jgi:MFS family permease
MSLFWISFLGTIAAIVYIVLLVIFGWATWQNGRKWMFVLGIVFPILWVIGGLMAPLPGSAGEQKFIRRYAEDPERATQDAVLRSGGHDLGPRPSELEKPGMARADRRRSPRT